MFAGYSASADFAIATTTPVPTTTTVSASASTTDYGQSVTITATVTPNDGGGTVEFLNGSNVVPGCAAVSLTLSGGNQQAQCSTSSLVPGSYVLKAKYSGDSNYAGSNSSGVGAGLTVDPAPLVVTPLSVSTTYGSAPPAITPSYAGFVNGDNAASLSTQPTCSTAVTAATAVGEYSSTCSGASDPNYTISYQVGTITVQPAPLSIAASSGTMTYGGTAPTVTASYSGFVNGDSAASLTTPPSCGTAATSSSAAGNYASTCAGAVDPNYAITYTNGTVAVGAAQLVITASSSSTTYGNDPPAVTASYKGFVNGDTASSLSTPPTCTTTETVSSPVGSYSTSCSGAADPNYTITYSNGNAEVDPAPLTITASSGMSAYGASPPSVTPSVSGLQNSENSTVLGNSLSCTTAASASSPVGSYATSCSGAVDGNYSITYVPGTITVTPALLSITASSGSMTYSGEVPTVTPTISGLQNGENIAVLGSALACTSDANGSSPVGSYATTCNGASDANYSISYVAGSITVNSAPLTITASSASMTYGGTVPTIMPVVSGLQNGDDASDLGSAVECSTAAGTTSPVGSYATACGGALDANYDISYVFGSVTVNPAALIVTASSPSMSYGDTHRPSRRPTTAL